MSLLDSPKIRRATAAMNQIMRRLDPPEALIVLGASAASTIVHSWREQEREEVSRHHSRHIEMAVQKLTEAIKQRKADNG
jgi:hypothetical protein